MKIWFNKIHDSRRSMIEVSDPVIHIGRDSSNTLVLQSPLVSKRHAVVTVAGGKLTLQNVGINGCQVGEAEVLGGESIEFEPGQLVRIWPYSLSFESEQQQVVTVAQMTAHLRSELANLELRIHRKLLERLDLYELESRRVGGSDSILLLENHIEDICRELGLFGPENAAVLEEITGLTLHDYLVNQLILEGGRFASSAPAGLTQNEFDVPATLISERETELQ
ncbi:MAG: FHA domain-containing protein, partial [Planctomycetaceae bacterium]